MPSKKKEVKATKHPSLIKKKGKSYSLIKTLKKIIKAT